MAAVEPEHDRRYDQSKRDRAKALYVEKGYSVREVAEELGVSPRRAWVFLQEAGVAMRMRGRPKKGEG